MGQTQSVLYNVAKDCDLDYCVCVCVCVLGFRGPMAPFYNIFSDQPPHLDIVGVLYMDWYIEVEEEEGKLQY